MLVMAEIWVPTKRLVGWRTVLGQAWGGLDLKNENNYNFQLLLRLVGYSNSVFPGKALSGLSGLSPCQDA